jgi:UDP-N-acetylmuramoyl-L-alanyl-D-glutamate--2,6-diaminopimelate ligase
VVITNDNPRFEAPDQIVQQILQGIDGDIDIELDRRRAIATSIIQAEKQDMVLIAGKGHENYQIIGSISSYFSDQDEALSALETAQLSITPSIEGGVL